MSNCYTSVITVKLSNILMIPIAAEDAEQRELPSFVGAIEDGTVAFEVLQQLHQHPDTAIHANSGTLMLLSALLRIATPRSSKNVPWQV